MTHQLFIDDTPLHVVTEFKHFLFKYQKAIVRGLISIEKETIFLRQTAITPFEKRI